MPLDRVISAECKEEGGESNRPLYEEQGDTRESRLAGVDKLLD